MFYFIFSFKTFLGTPLLGKLTEIDLETNT